MAVARTHSTDRTDRGLPRRFAFTIIELLVVVAIILILASLLIVAINQASRAGQKANTVALMDSIAKGLERFKNDIGYYPPMLGPSSNPVVRLREHFPAPAQGGGYQAAIQDWYSTAAMADYLVGWGSHIEDGYGALTPPPAANFDWAHETPAAGIRHPGIDGVWDATVNGAGTGLLIDRMKTPTGAGAVHASELAPGSLDQGQVYGPYLELQDSTIMGSTDGTFDPATGNLRVFFPGQPGYNAAGPMVICDYWGTPIRYFRRPFPPGAIGQSYRANTDINRDGAVDANDIVPTLSDLYLLRPWEIKPGTETVNRFLDGDGKSASTRDLDAAEFALWSAGPDRSHNASITVDAIPPNDQQRNKDNIVKLGPS